MFDSKVLLISTIDISSIFVFEISAGFFIRFFGYMSFIVYVFDTTITFFLFIELVLTKIIKDVLSEYRV